MENMRKKDLGFGCMRMPLIDPKDIASFDFDRIAQLFDAFLEKGFKYFDVAYTCHGYHAEEAVRRALTERYPRDGFLLATKMPLRDFRDEQDMERIWILYNCRSIIWIGSSRMSSRADVWKLQTSTISLSR